MVAVLCKVQRDRNGTSAQCCGAVLLLVAMLVRACQCKAWHGECCAPVYGRVAALLLAVAVERACLCKVQGSK